MVIYVVTIYVVLLHSSFWFQMIIWFQFLFHVIYLHMLVRCYDYLIIGNIILISE